MHIHMHDMTIDRLSVLILILRVITMFPICFVVVFLLIVTIILHDSFYDRESIILDPQDTGHLIWIWFLFKPSLDPNEQSTEKMRLRWRGGCSGWQTFNFAQLGCWILARTIRYSFKGSIRSICFFCVFWSLCSIAGVAVLRRLGLTEKERGWN